MINLHRLEIERGAAAIISEASGGGAPMAEQWPAQHLAQSLALNLAWSNGIAEHCDPWRVIVGVRCQSRRIASSRPITRNSFQCLVAGVGIVTHHKPLRPIAIRKRVTTGR